ncbi:mannose-1-phosphate guanylyltransferase/mannose-6-phosphate isomerase [Caulobacter vibrioides]|uniref:mannose-1-phosphate guanylyltransferase/mannose-6-phosphate isomerase n=1 Tax=Caulobacter vibrioides TaxID=155892 RepID=UPI000BB46C34|nr:mannose-1-phosphate guanylyltransferase/mannose-6-phosphate isomerase [Caulobacter vibrioides]ATC26468.1 mannose-1-phosphate guanylyltransferase/mannose-6-phosphate isomerase [Caulobacter vibrioides]AZH14600.1 mannose-1-phosphate guanylyltransferase/mannose-6-phosphate isomerase [Caulobacter vibrioides]PLR12290.1 mannose-1-phosphate guanylyltransferase/mannose-6-phosphate isomerase [Caulobacter vibrioides]
MAAIYPVILCGGSGTRLWPASRSDHPKQFLKLVSDRSSFQETVLRVKDIPGVAEVVVVTGEAMVGFVSEQTAEIGAWATILVEPEARDSAPAVAAAAAYVEAQDPAGVVLMLAADHHIAQPEIFQQAALTAAKAAEQGYIVTFGVQPTVPATGFGYIRPGAPLLDGSVREVAAFVEKPDQATAERYLLEGYLWNSGNFAFQAATLLGEFETFEPSVAAAAKACVAGLQLEAGIGRLDREAFAQAKKISLDYAIMERTQKAAVAPAAFAWSDLGAWDAIWEASTRDGDGNAQTGDVDLHGSSNVLVRSTGPYVGVIGVNDIVVVAEPDAVLVCHRKDSQAVKTLVDGLKAKGRSIASRKSASPNGTETLVSTDGFDVELRRVPAGETLMLPVSTLQVLEGVIEMDGDVYAAGAIIALDDSVQARAIGAATLLVTKPR